MDTALGGERRNTKMDPFQTATGSLSYTFILHICHTVSTHKVEVVGAPIKGEKCHV